jgi:hypothetical protein
VQQRDMAAESRTNTYAGSERRGRSATREHGSIAEQIRRKRTSVRRSVLRGSLAISYSDCP